MSMNNRINTEGMVILLNVIKKFNAIPIKMSFFTEIILKVMWKQKTPNSYSNPEQKELY
jgi:hypothetical protein